MGGVYREHPRRMGDTADRETFVSAERSECVEDYAEHGRSISPPKHG